MNPTTVSLSRGIRHHLAEMRWRGRLPVYIYLLSRMDAATGLCDPSVETIANDAGLHMDTATRAIKWLCERGFIERIGRPGRSNQYRARPINDNGTVRMADGSSRWPDPPPGPPADCGLGYDESWESEPRPVRGPDGWIIPPVIRKRHKRQVPKAGTGIKQVPRKGTDPASPRQKPQERRK